MDDEAFWRKTPKQLAWIFEAHNMRMLREHNERAWIAWHIAALGRIQKMPPLTKMQAKSPAKPKHWEDQLADLKKWVVATGGKIVVRNH